LISSPLTGSGLGGEIIVAGVPTLPPLSSLSTTTTGLLPCPGVSLPTSLPLLIAINALLARAPASSPSNTGVPDIPNPPAPVGNGGTGGLDIRLVSDPDPEASNHSLYLIKLKSLLLS